MANAREHAIVGAIAGAAFGGLHFYLKKQKDPNVQFDFGEFLGHVLIGCVAGLLPDILEPAKHPNHRKLFHGVAVGGALAYGAFGEPSRNLKRDEKAALQTFAIGYLSHLGLDSQTPKGIPLVA